MSEKGYRILVEGMELKGESMPTVDTTEITQARAGMARVMAELGSSGGYKDKPDENGDAVDWLDYAISEIRHHAPDQFDDQDWIVQRLLRIRDAAWDALVDERLESMNRDAIDG